MGDTHWLVLDLMLEHRQMTVHHIAAAANISLRQAQRVVKLLRDRQKLYIARWVRTGTRGSPCAVYAIGKRPDAPRPEPLSAAEHQMAWRRRKRQSET